MFLFCLKRKEKKRKLFEISVFLMWPNSILILILENCFAAVMMKMTIWIIEFIENKTAKKYFFVFILISSRSLLSPKMPSLQTFSILNQFKENLKFRIHFLIWTFVCS